jgi:TatD DNase family protein
MQISTFLLPDELRRKPIIAPILHWWTGTAAETLQAVELGCYFSVHSAVAWRSLFRTQVPLERLLVETDHGWAELQRNRPFDGNTEAVTSRFSKPITRIESLG